jgi:hypothetical protein
VPQRQHTTDPTIMGTTESAMATSTRAPLGNSRSPRLPTHGGAVGGLRECGGSVGRRSYVVLEDFWRAATVRWGAVWRRRSVYFFFLSPSPPLRTGSSRPSTSRPPRLPQERHTTYDIWSAAGGALPMLADIDEPPSGMLSHPT